MATANLKSISAKIDDGQGTIGALINDKTMYTQLDQTTAGMRDTMVHAQAGIADFQENMEALKQNFLLRGYFKKRGYEDSAELAKDEIASLPEASPLKTFTYEPKNLFDKIDTAELKNQGSLSTAGKFLAGNEFGVAVVVVYTGATGDTQKDLVLTQARAAVVRAYLVGNFGFDDTQLKTLGMGKKLGEAPTPARGEMLRSLSIRLALPFLQTSRAHKHNKRRCMGWIIANLSEESIPTANKLTVGVAYRRSMI